MAKRRTAMVTAMVAVSPGLFGQAAGFDHQNHRRAQARQEPEAAPERTQLRKSSPHIKVCILAHSIRNGVPKQTAGAGF